MALFRSDFAGADQSRAAAMLRQGKGNGAIATLVPAGATVVLSALLLRRWWRSRKEPPSFQMGLPVIGPIIQFLKDPMELMRLGYKKMGGIFKVNFLAMDMVYLVGPEGQEWFFTSDKYLDQAKMYKFTVPIFGPKVLYDVDYSTRTCQLRFIRERLTDSYIRSYTRKCRHRYGDHGNRLTEMLHILEKGMLPMSVFWPKAPIKRHFERDKARRQIHEMIKPILDQRRAKDDKTEKDFMQSVLNSTYPDGRPITDEEIVGFLIAAFFGGMHNSAITTSWSTLEIFSRPELVKELLAEQREALGGDSAPFTFQAYEKMKKLRSAVSEVLRMHPPLFLLMRTVEQDVEFKGYTIRRGSVVATSPNVSHMIDDFYPDAKTFDPKRFVDGIKDEFNYIPFGGGRRVCKGQEFGYLQVQCAISHMLRHYNIETIDGVPPPTIAQDGMVIAPEQPCRVRYTRKA
ncbi:unnamed protein product [Effrenium voratum]|nr:unnamed protein product [Effrenium voratum]